MCTNYVPSSRDLIREHLQIQLPTIEYVDEFWSMADDLTKSGGQKRKRVNMNQGFEVRDWSKKFGVRADELER